MAVEIRADRGDAGGGWLPATGSLLGVVALGSCCVLPLVLVSLGVGGAFIGQLTALYAYKWYTLAFAVIVIGWGFRAAYRPVPVAECADGTCATPINRRLMRGLVWTAAVLATLAFAFPYAVPYLMPY